MKTLKLFPLSNLVASCLLLLPALAFAQLATDVDCSKCVDTADIAVGAIGNARIEDNAVNGAKIKNKTVRADDLANGAVTTRVLADQSVTLEKLAEQSVAIEMLDESARAKITGDTAFSNVGMSLGTCVNNGFITLTVFAPSVGKIMVDAQVQFAIEGHVQGTANAVAAYIGTAVDECTSDSPSEGYFRSRWYVRAEEPSYTSRGFTPPMPLSRTYTVFPGTHTFYVNGVHAEGSAIIYFYSVSAQAVFYPGAG